MKTAVVYYSLGGSTRKLAQKEAERREADIFELREAKKRNIFTAFIPGCPQAMKQRAVPLEYAPDLSEYDHFVLMSPVWAGFPAPAFNSALNILPDGANIDVILLSGGGDTPKSRDAVKALIKSSGYTLGSYTDIKAEA